MTEWPDIVRMLADGPRAAISGVVHADHTDTGPTTFYDAHYGIAPSHVGFGTAPMRLRRSGRRCRLDTVSGTPVFIFDGDTAWVFDARNETPIKTTVEHITVHEPGVDLIVSGPEQRWTRPPFVRPTREVCEIEFLGRRCWRVDLREEGDGGELPRKLIVDIETGAVLLTQTPRGTAQYEAFSTSDPAPDDAFTWTGTVRVPRNLLAEDRARETRRRNTAMDWYRANVHEGRLHATVLVDFTPTDVRLDPDDPNAFEALCENGTVRMWRRTRSGSDWNLRRNWGRRYPMPITGWSTENFDWACAVDLGPHAMIDDTLAAIRQAMHPDEPVVGAPTIP